MDVEDRLSAFLKPYAEKTVTWGEDDCTAVAARWLWENGHSFALPRYTSRREAQEIIIRHGGLVETWRALLPASVAETGDPQLGDIGIIDTRKFGPVGVIFAAAGVCLWRRDEGGFHFIKPRTFLRAWAI